MIDTKMTVASLAGWAFLTAAALLMCGAVSAGTITGKVKVPGMRDHADVLVYIASAPGQFVPKETPSVTQRGLKFEPHVLPVVVGTTVRFENEDDVQHNIFTPSASGDFFNLGTWPKGQTRTYTFSKMGKVDLLCNVHHEMRSYVLVLQNPFFAVTDKEGNFRIANVPPGDYTVKVWHEHASGEPQTVKVSSSGTLTIGFELARR